ncbi:MAG: glycosyl hydrolase [Planctomycetia bacterium]|nr:glycosyl hydrolase [Planctomycetia bacterium]
MQKIFFALLSFLLFLSPLFGNENPNRISPEKFAAVSSSAKPWVYYWWLKANITKEKITADLEEMQKKGVGGILLFDSRYYHDEFDSKTNVPVPLYIKHEFMNPDWRKLILHTIREADRLGMKVSMNISDSGGVLRGPWDLKQDGPKELVWTEENVNGPKSLDLDLTAPMGYKFYKDIAVLALRMDTPSTPNREEIRLNQAWGNIVFPTDQSQKVLEMVDLTKKIKKRKLSCEIPEGSWKIVRFGYHVVGEVGCVDILSKEVVNSYFDRMCGQIIKDAGNLAGKTLTHFYNVSWEGSNPDWTVGFEKEFESRRKYDLRSMLPVLRGLIVGDLDQSLRFLADYHKTVSDCFRENCYQTIGQRCHEHGILWHSEDGGDWRRTSPLFREADMLSFWGQNDIPQGEFWVNEEVYSRKSNMRFCAMAAHIHGQREVACEAFTHMDRHWSMYPDWLKAGADINFIDGTNMLIWHTFTASMPELGKPGFEYFAGTHINTNTTWWNKVGPFMQYLGRCQYLLRKGDFVADVCAYVSDKNYVPRGSRGEKWNPDSDLFLPPGYTYDLLNTDVLVNDLDYQNGAFVLPHGMKYRILAVDPIEDRLPAEALEKIVQLAKKGAPIVLGKKKPLAAIGAYQKEDHDRRLSSAVEQLWTDDSTVFSLGKGKVYLNTTMDQVLKAEKILPDFEGAFETIHRRTAQEEIYFVSGSGSSEGIFRVKGKVPRLWDPISGKIRPVDSWSSTDDGRTKIKISLPLRGSVFVVFSPEKTKDSLVSVSGPDQGIELTGEKNRIPSGIFWRPGKYELTMKSGKTHSFNVKLPSPISLTAHWTLSFDPKWGGPEKIVFEKLSLWNEHSDPGIRFYSGSVLYTKTFSLTKEQIGNPVRLELGEVHKIASARLNGKDLGIAWTAPWTLDLTNAVKEGNNLLEIEITNCWANRLIGDAGLPKEKRFTKTNLYLEKKQNSLGRKLNRWQGFWSDDSLIPSGLLGPVQIRFGKNF